MDLVEGSPRCVKRAYAGTVLGVVMGGFASFANAIQAHGTKLPSLIMRDAIVRRSVGERSLRTMGIIGVWSGVYQTTRCVLDERGVTDPENTVLSAGVSVSPLLAIGAIRTEVPWVLILIGLDIYHRPAKPTTSS